MQVRTPVCSQCNSPLIFVSEVTETIEGSRFPQTTKTYICSNEECQKEKDKETQKRIKLKEERQLAEEERSKKRQKQKMDKMQSLKP